MLSGNGRHRRPRQAPAILVAAGVTGSAIAIPLLGATGASAATGTTWDQVANCETDGSWSENAGDGYYGGLHIAQDDWEQYGGLDYASRADQASRSQQIAVAEKILADQGVGYWSTCGLLNGLSKDTAAPGVDTGVADDATSGAKDSSGSSGSSGLSDSSGSSADSSGDAASDAPSSSVSPTPSDSDARSDSSGEADNSAKSDTSSDSAATPGASQGSGGDSGSDSTGVTNPDDSDNFWQEGGSSALVDTGSLGAGKHRGDSADETAAATDTDAGTAAADAGASAGRHAARADSYTVRPGDTLASIADSLGLQGGWRELYAENKQAIGADASVIVPGQTLTVGIESGEN
ncbi:transglycosylase family protein [Streptomyces sp. NBC_01373]|uniref:LysM peptidoglycan-binding domain-containing protein n=1 Tax=Streptomyces sp. NBC_01373 TaxID=2903843 RepID=UPI0022525C84|nr:transglycosylase family protein [Streptomyces sp. NBC_01373]MCX4700198.1 LysM peptidoglycan-binding domain-containing protein [Streptomyces sp. NBC_01373]